MKPRPRRQRLAEPSSSSREPPAGPAELRIIGGACRGRKIRYTGDPRTRPMKDRVREAVFNLVGPDVVGSHAIDLFAGSGAIGLEALSRGAAHATFFERHFPTAAVIRENARALGLESRADVLPADTFVHFKRRVAFPTATDAPRWTVFCSPPFDFFVDRREALLTLINTLLAAAPPGSVFVVESDQRFDPAVLPQPEGWDVRDYPPALVAILRKPRSAPS